MNDPFSSSGPSTGLSDGRADSLPVLKGRADAVRWVRLQMARHDITLVDLIAAGCFVSRKSEDGESAIFPVRYLNADGQSWDGLGELPEWLQRAIHAGQSMEHFRVG